MWPRKPFVRKTRGMQRERIVEHRAPEVLWPWCQHRLTQRRHVYRRKAARVQYVRVHTLSMLEVIMLIWSWRHVLEQVARIGMINWRPQSCRGVDNHIIEGCDLMLRSFTPCR